MPHSLRTARLTLAAAAVLWSTSGFFVRLLQQPSALGLDDPPLSPLQIAFFRSLFAGLCVLPMVRPAAVRFRPAMLGMTLAFAVMTALYLSALGRGSAANAIFLQNTAPVWVCVAVFALYGERPDRRTLRSVLLAMFGAAAIVLGNWPRGADPGDQSAVLLMATGSGMFYAAVILFLRALRAESPAWLTSLNMLGTAAVLAVGVAVQGGVTSAGEWLTAPTLRQLGWLAVFGGLQLAFPYVLFARGLKTVSPQEAGLITLIEPLLVPVWAYLIAPDRDTPTAWTLVGGGILLLALAWRYLPTGRVTPRSSASRPSPSPG